MQRNTSNRESGGATLDRGVSEGLPEVSELRPEHLSMPAWEVPEVSEKDVFSQEPNAQGCTWERRAAWKTASQGTSPGVVWHHW